VRVRGILTHGARAVRGGRPPLFRAARARWVQPGVSCSRTAIPAGRSTVTGVRGAWSSAAQAASAPHQLAASPLLSPPPTFINRGQPAAHPSTSQPPPARSRPNERRHCLAHPPLFVFPALLWVFFNWAGPEQHDTVFGNCFPTWPHRRRSLRPASVFVREKGLARNGRSCWFRKRKSAGRRPGVVYRFLVLLEHDCWRAGIRSLARPWLVGGPRAGRPGLGSLAPRSGRL
jgi:hypothetical protein